VVFQRGLTGSNSELTFFLRVCVHASELRLDRLMASCPVKSPQQDSTESPKAFSGEHLAAAGPGQQAGTSSLASMEATIAASPGQRRAAQSTVETGKRQLTAALCDSEEGPHANPGKHRLLVDESLSNTPGVGQSAWDVTTPAASRTLVGSVFPTANGGEGQGSQHRGDAIEELRYKLEQVHARRMWLQANLQASGASRTRGSV